MNKHQRLLNTLTGENYLYGKNRRHCCGFVLERNVSDGNDPTDGPVKEYRLSTLHHGGKVAESCCFDADEAHIILMPLRYISMKELRKYWT